VAVGQCFGVLVMTTVFLGRLPMVLVIVTGGHAGLEIGHLYEKSSVQNLLNLAENHTYNRHIWLQLQQVLQRARSCQLHRIGVLLAITQ